MYWLKPPHQILKTPPHPPSSPHVLNTCGKPCIQGFKVSPNYLTLVRNISAQCNVIRLYELQFFLHIFYIKFYFQFLNIWLIYSDMLLQNNSKLLLHLLEKLDLLPAVETLLNALV